MAAFETNAPRVRLSPCGRGIAAAAVSVSQIWVRGVSASVEELRRHPSSALRATFSHKGRRASGAQTFLPDDADTHEAAGADVAGHDASLAASLDDGSAVGVAGLVERRVIVAPELDYAAGVGVAILLDRAGVVRAELRDAGNVALTGLSDARAVGLADLRCRRHVLGRAPPALCAGGFGKDGAHGKRGERDAREVGKLSHVRIFQSRKVRWQSSPCASLMVR